MTAWLECALVDHRELVWADVNGVLEARPWRRANGRPVFAMKAEAPESLSAGVTENNMAIASQRAFDIGGRKGIKGCCRSGNLFVDTKRDRCDVGLHDIQ